MYYKLSLLQVSFGGEGVVGMAKNDKSGGWIEPNSPYKYAPFFAITIQWYLIVYFSLLVRTGIVTMTKYVLNKCHADC